MSYDIFSEKCPHSPSLLHCHEFGVFMCLCVCVCSVHMCTCVCVHMCVHLHTCCILVGMFVVKS